MAKNNNDDNVITNEARTLHNSSDVIDLHIDSFIWTRLLGYDIRHKHMPGIFRGNFFGQVDLPRLEKAQVNGAIWSITTQPFAPAWFRKKALKSNFEKLQNIFKSASSEVCLVKTQQDYVRSKAMKLHAAWIGIQGGNAIGDDVSIIDELGDALIKVTLVHLSSSNIGVTSTPVFKEKSECLSPLGHELIAKLNSKRIFVDLAHISRKGFFEALASHDRTLPPLVSHTCAQAVYSHWRNLDDEQIHAIADRGGVMGVMYQTSFLNGTWGKAGIKDLLNHLEHFINVGGEDCVALGSDWDGLIVPPFDMPTCLELPRLTQKMLERGWSVERIQKILGLNFLRALTQLRG